MSVTLRALTVRTSLCTCKYTQVCIFQITDTFVYKPNVCNLTNVCALASAHTSNLFVYMHISTQIHILCDGHFCTRTPGAETHICLSPWERSQLEPLCVHANTHKYAFFRSQILLYTNPMCATSHMSVPPRVLTVRTFLYTCIYTHIHISYYGHFCTGIHGAETHIWLFACERSLLEPLCLHTNTHKYTFSDHR